MNDFMSNGRLLSHVDGWSVNEVPMSVKHKTLLEPEVILMETHTNKDGRKWSSMNVRISHCNVISSLHIGKANKPDEDGIEETHESDENTRVAADHCDNSTSYESEGNCYKDSNRTAKNRHDKIEITLEKATAIQEAVGPSKSFVKNSATDFLDYYECPFCTSCFSFKTDFQRHVRLHTRLKTFQCSVCAKRFAEKIKLEKHRVEHVGEKPNTCSVCEKAFKHKSALSRHAKLHTGEGHECLVCHRIFTTRQTFDVHTRKHTGERPYKCSTCHKCFSSLGNLSNHIIIHKAEKPYKCTVCNKKFTQQGNLKIHTRLHTGEKPFQCPICKRPFSLKGNLKSHMKVHIITK